MFRVNYKIVKMLVIVLWNYSVQCNYVDSSCTNEKTIIILCTVVNIIEDIT